MRYAMAVDTTKLLHLIAVNKINYIEDINKRSKQLFFGFDFDDLIKTGCVMLEYFGVDNYKYYVTSYKQSAPQPTQQTMFGD